MSLRQGDSHLGRKLPACTIVPWNNSGGLVAGGDYRLTQGDVEDFSKHPCKLVSACPKSPARNAIRPQCFVGVTSLESLSHSSHC